MYKILNTENKKSLVLLTSTPKVSGSIPSVWMELLLSKNTNFNIPRNDFRCWCDIKKKKNNKYMESSPTDNDVI